MAIKATAFSPCFLFLLVPNEAQNFAGITFCKVGKNKSVALKAGSGNQN
ncbi:MAG: hypothetical protein ACOYN4_11995 [Bacteroidales bacterium]